ncbi:hypothetical protein GGR55DRAFT_264601 [Xylaria sp. FL0064]|nr:hypothetical protein GGR55DRAFT_264601 [Xylaria sp. FL0064]
MEIAGFGLAVVATADLCLKYGDRVAEICSSYRHAQDELKEKAVKAANAWMRVSTQLKFLQKIEAKLTDEHRIVLDQCLRAFSAKLTKVNRELEAYSQREEAESPRLTLKKRVKYAFKKQSLEKVLDALRRWDEEFDPTWYLTILITDQQLDDELTRGFEGSSHVIQSARTIRTSLDESEQSNNTARKGLSLSAGELHSMDVKQIHLCNARVASRGINGKFYVLDEITYYDLGDTASKIVRENVRNLAQRLQHDSPETSGLLQCKGFITGMAEEGANDVTKYTLVLRGIQEHRNPQSLRSLLTSGAVLDSLSTKFEIARTLARSVSYVHSFRFVHKNLCPETIVTFQHAGDSGLSTFLVGFGDFRAEYGRSAMRGDDLWERNLYRHPSRQGATPQDDYRMQHDIYSLGVCLLEIGLWKSFVEYDGLGTSRRLGSALQLPPNSEPSTYLLATMKDNFVALARGSLPKLMGTEFAEIVETCLTCLDPNNIDFGDPGEFMDLEGVSIGVRYIEKVLLRLNELRV